MDGLIKKEEPKTIEERVDTMRSLRDILEEQIQKEKEVAQQKIFDIVYLGTIEVPEIIEGKEVVVQKELYQITRNQDGHFLIQYYIEDDLIAIEDSLLGILPEQDYLTKTELIDQIILRKEDPNAEPISLNEKEEERIEKLSLVTNKPKEEIRAYTEADIKNIHFAAEIDADEKVTKTQDFYDLVPDAKNYVKIGVVANHSSLEGNTMFHVVGITEKGEVKQLEGIEPQEGISPTNPITQMNRDGSEITKENVSALFFFPGIKNNQQDGLAIRIGPYGEIEIKYLRQDLATGQCLSSPIETQTQKPTTHEVREMMDSSKNISIREEAERANGKMQDGSTQIEDIDDNPNNDKSETYIVITEKGEKIDLRQEAEKCKISIEEYMRLYEEQDGTVEEKIEAVEQLVNEQFRGSSEE